MLCVHARCDAVARYSGGGRTFEAAEMSLTFVKFIASTDSGKRRKVTTPRELYSKYTRMHCVATLTPLKKFSE